MKNKKKIKLKKKIFTVSIIILFLLMGFSLGYFSYKYYKSNKIANNIFFEEDNPQINEIIIANKELNITKLIYQTCNQEELPQDKLYCLNDYVQKHYKYQDVGNEIYTIDEMFKDGADCKSYSFYYATLADMMGFDYTFIIIKNHVATIVPFENGYCLLDQSVADCIGY